MVVLSDFETPGQALPPDDGSWTGPQWFWARAEYLYYWVKSGPNPVPLLTTGSFADPLPGALGQPGTRLLFGSSELGYGTFSGGRLTASVPLDSEGSFALEGRGFLLERRSAFFGVAGDAAGQPVLVNPFFNVRDGFEDIASIALPGILTGQFDFSSTSRLWGAEANALAGSRLLAGFRYLNLEEDVRLLDNLVALPGSSLSFLGQPVPPPNRVATADRFGTRNQFFGGQLGAQIDLYRGPWSVNLTGKVALGSTHQVVAIDGSTTLIRVAGGGPNATVPGGFFALATNLGQRTTRQFGVIPEVEIRMGYQLSPALSVSLAYSFLYWNQVVRPGDQIDRNLNPNLVPGFADFAPLVGPAQPVPQFRRTDFWAQGLNFAVELQY